MLTLRLTVLALLVAVPLALPAATATPDAQPDPPAARPAPPPNRERVRLDDDTRVAVHRALKWLAGHQEDRGNWGNSAVTGFAVMAFLSNGHLPNQGEFGPTVAKAVGYLLACDRGDGYLGSLAAGNHAMYCHGMATLALSQVYGMTGDPKVKEVLDRAVDRTVRSQSKGGGRRGQGDHGGWRYQPNPNCGADVSVTIMQVMALRGAKDSGVNVPNQVMEDAVAYILRCGDGTGGFRYMPGSREAEYARTAAGLCSLQLCAAFDNPDVEKAIDRAVEFLEGRPDSSGKWRGGRGGDPTYPWYGHYYAAHALHQYAAKGKREADLWEQYYTRIKDRLLASQLPRRRDGQEPAETGYWSDGSVETRMGGTALPTAIAVIILSVPYHYLPIYQK